MKTIRITIDEILDLISERYKIKNVKLMTTGEYGMWTENYSDIVGVEGEEVIL